ncbi:aspartate carbamoyltransferase regulatory subunit [Psychromonas sp. CD1]|uniref:aspartate carbamoyltransferase regulatory subunit n=1 Tax=Psychromonas sp. CD1 TaxID=1979839 RepID=UPI000B9A511F|nr:aspartate carbamoyltransferase regulatory subunit [Psychromonas sp. CD1]
MIKKTKLQVEAIKNGTVIDHIPATLGIKVLKLFQIDKTHHSVTIGLNLPSSALGKKDIIKIENVLITKDQANLLALYTQNATINQIKDYEVSKKFQLTLPEKVNAVFSCPNSNCITHNEPVETSFNVICKNDILFLRCKYCEKVFSREIMAECN